MAVERMDIALLWFLVFSCVSQPLCSAQELTCTVTQNFDHTTYSISDVPRNVEASSCEYTWANASQNVFAHNKEKTPGLVTTNSINTLVTTKCFDKIIYTRSCLSEGEGYTAKCATSCSVDARKDKETSFCWIAAFLGVVVVVLVMLLGSLCYRFRDKTLSICMDTAVENQDDDL